MLSGVRARRAPLTAAGRCEIQGWSKGLTEIVGRAAQKDEYSSRVERIAFRRRLRLQSPGFPNLPDVDAHSDRERVRAFTRRCDAKLAANTMAQNALAAGYAALQEAATQRGLSVEQRETMPSTATIKKCVAGLGVKLPPDAFRFFALTNGMRVNSDAGEELLLGGQFRAPPLHELVREYRRVWATPDDAVAALDCIFPIFVSAYGEFLGYDARGRDHSLYEISLSNPQPLLAFSDMATTLKVFAAYVAEAGVSLDLAIAQRVHERLDPKTALRYWS